MLTGERAHYELAASRVDFTFFWPQAGTWEGRDYQVDVVDDTPPVSG